MDIEEERKYFIQNCREYIYSVRWQNAKTYEATAPHEYTVVHWNPDRKQWFEDMVNGIRRYGYKKKFGNKTYVYLDIDGKSYWTLGMPSYMTTLINRAESGSTS